MTRRQQLDNIFKNVDEEQKSLVSRLIDEVIFLEERMSELKELPFIRVHPDDSTLQKPTAAAKLYKECTQSYMNAIRILCSLLNKSESTTVDDLKSLLEQYA